MKNNDNQMREAIEGTGYTFYRMKSNPKMGLIAVPEEYNKRAQHLADVAAKIKYLPGTSEADKLKVEDRVYLVACLCKSYDDVNSKEGQERKDAESRVRFFKKLLEGILLK